MPDYSTRPKYRTFEASGTTAIAVHLKVGDIIALTYSLMTGPQFAGVSGVKLPHGEADPFLVIRFRWINVHAWSDFHSIWTQTPQSELFFAPDDRITLYREISS